jgi:hypothetical protein
MSYYSDPCHYIDDCTSLKDKIARIDSVIVALEDAALKSAGKQSIDEYWMDDGQTKVKAIYRSTEDIANAILDFERVRQMYINRLNTRVITLKDKYTNRLRHR